MYKWTHIHIKMKLWEKYVFRKHWMRAKVFLANFSAEVILIKMKRQLDQLASVVIAHHWGLSAEARYWTTEHGLQGWLWKVSAKYLLNNAEPSQCYNATSCWFHPGWCKNCKLLNFQDLKCLAPKDLGMTTQHILTFPNLIKNICKWC